MSSNLLIKIQESSPASLAERVRRLSRLLRVCRLDDSSSLEELYTLRFNCYSKEGAITRCDRNIFNDEYDGMSNAYNIGFYFENKLVAGIRISILSSIYDRSSSMSSFSDIVRPILEAGGTVVDPSRFVIDHDFSRTYTEIPYIVTRIPIIAGHYFQASTVLVTVRSEHMAFYKRVLQCEKAADPRPYPGLRTPLNLMIADYRVVAPKVIARYPSYAFEAEEGEGLFGRKSKPLALSLHVSPDVSLAGSGLVGAPPG